MTTVQGFSEQGLSTTSADQRTATSLSSANQSSHILKQQRKSVVGRYNSSELYYKR